MAIYCSNLFLYHSNTIDRASTVSGNSRFRCEVMIWRASNALKCRSHSAEDAGLTSSSSCAIGQYRIILFVLFPPIKWVKNISCSVNFWWVNGESASIRDPYDPLFTLPWTHPILGKSTILRSIWSRVGARKHILDGGSWSPYGKEHFWGLHLGLPAVDILNLTG